MPDAFDPYLQWLGIPEGPRPPDHYTLLGLSPRESDPQAIAQAADMQMARLRRIRPGAQLADWSRLLDQINAVKVCLTNPASKADYDATMPTGASAAPVAAPQAAPSQPSMALPPNLANGPVDRDADRPRVPFPVGYSQAPTIAAAGSTWSAPPSAPDAAWSARPMAATSPADEPQMPWTGLRPAKRSAPTAAGQQPVPVQQPIPVAAAAGTAVAAPSATMLGNPSPTPSPSPSTTAAAAKRPSVAKKKVIGSLATVVLLAAVAGLGYTLYDVIQKSENGQLARNAGAGDPAPKPAAASPENENKNAEKSRPATNGKSGSAAAGPASSNPATQPVSASLKPLRPATPQSNPANVVAQASPGGAAASPPPPAAATDDAAKRAAFNKAMSDARFALSAREYGDVKKFLAAARSSAQTPADLKEVDRVEQIEAYMTGFWKSIRGVMPKLEGELPVKDTFISIVESNEREILLKVAGEMRRYAVEDMPVTLIAAIAEKRFKPDAGWKVLYGTFLAMDSQGDRNRARQLWREAGQGGFETGLLLPELDVPLESATKSPSGQSSAPRPGTTAGPGNAGGSGNTAGGSGNTMDVGGGDLASQIADLGQRASAARTQPQHSEVARDALAACQKAVEAKKWDQAKRLAEIAQNAAKEAKNVSMMRQSSAALQLIEAMRKQQ